MNSSKINNYKINFLSFSKNKKNLKYSESKKDDRVKDFFRKSYVHSTFSCHKNLHQFTNILNTILNIDDNNKINSSKMSHNKKLALFNTIKRCLYSRYSDNIKKVNKTNSCNITNIPTFVRRLFPYFQILYKLSENISISDTEKKRIYSNKEDNKEITKALVHFSIINSLKKLYIILDYLISKKCKINKIEYFENYNNLIIDYNSIINKYHNKINQKLYNKQLVFFYISVLQIYHNSNFLIIYDNQKNITTQIDLFDNNQTQTINTISKTNYINKLPQNLNFTYKNRNILNNKIDFRELYNPISKITNENIIPIYLDIFSSQYYTTNYTLKNITNMSKIEKVDITNKSRIKNKILQILQNNHITSNNQYTNIILTYFYNKIKNDYINPIYNYNHMSLIIPDTLFIKDDEKILPDINQNVVLPPSVSYNINLSPQISSSSSKHSLSSSKPSSLLYSKHSSSSSSKPSSSTSSKHSSSTSSKHSSSSTSSSSTSSKHSSSSTSSKPFSKSSLLYKHYL